MTVVLAASAAVFSGCGGKNAFVSVPGSLQGVNANIAFMGDSITNYWKLPKSNLGVGGNTTAQMLARYPSEVPGHHFKAIVILGGTNDVRIPQQPIVARVTEAIANLTQMAELAESENLEVVICALPPIQGETSRVLAMNKAIAAMVAKHGYKYVDYYTPMAGHPEYFRDSVHPNDAGYAVMQGTLENVIPLNY